MITDSHQGISLRTAAVIGGLGLLLMAILAPIAQFGVLQGVIVDGDAAATAANIAESEGMFRVAIACFLLVAVLDVVVALALYVVFRPVNAFLSGLTAMLRIVYGAMFAVSLTGLVTAAQLATGSNQDSAQVLASVDAFQTGWDIALAVFGTHLLLLGILVFQSGAWRGILGLLVLITSAGYLIDGWGRLLLPGYDLMLVTFTFVGEVVLMIWLLWESARGFPAELEG
jgi:hypothetical protein